MKEEFFKNVNNILKRILIGKTMMPFKENYFFLGQNGYSYQPIPLLRIALLGIANNASMSQSRKSLRDSLHVKDHCSISQKLLGS